MKPHLAPLAGALLLSLATPAAAQVRPDPNQDRQADLTVRKTGPAIAVAGQATTFTVQVGNAGASTVTAQHGVVVTDVLPAGFTGPVTATGSGWSCATGLTVSCTYVGGPVGPYGQFPALTITARAGGQSSFVNCADVTVRRGRDPKPANNKSCVEGRLRKPDGEGGGRVDLQVRKSGPSTVPVGQSVTFTILVRNQGPATVNAATGVFFQDSLPTNFSGATASGAGWNCTVTGGSPNVVTCTYNGPPVPAGQQLPAVSITAQAVTPGPWLNCAKLDLKKGADANSADNKHCIEGRVTDKPPGGRYDLGVRKTYTPPSAPGQPAGFTINAFNIGPSSVNGASGVTVTDQLPANFQPNITASGTGWTCNLTGSGPWTMVCNYTSTTLVGAGQSFPPIQISAATGQPGVFTNCAEISLRAGPDVQPRDNRGCVRGDVKDTPKPKPDLALDKTALDGPWSWPSGTGVYRFRVTNLGNVAVPAGAYLTLTETLPAGMVVSQLPSGWNCSPGAGAQGPVTMTCTYGLPAALNPGAFIQFDLIVGFRGDKRPNYNNCARIGVTGTAAAWIEADLVNNRDCAPTEVTGGGAGGFNLGINKSGPGQPVIGQSATYTLTVENASNQPLDFYVPSSPPPFVSVYPITVTVTDTLPAMFGTPVSVNGGSAWSCQVSGLTISCTYIGGGVFPPGGGFPPITVTAPVVNPGQGQNCASTAIGGAWFIQDLAQANNRDCVDIQVRPVSGPASLVIEKVVDQDCTGTVPNTACKFMIRIFNTNGTPYTGPVTFTDTVFGGPNAVIPGVSLASPSPPGWTCTGAQPATCTDNSVTIPANGHITVPLYMTVAGPIPPNQNCAVLTAPVSAQSCVTMGSTHLNLGLDSNLLPVSGSSQKELSYWITSNPTAQNGMQVIVNGQVTTSGALSPMIVPAGWSCSGPWTSFVCTHNVGPGSFSGGFLVLRLRTTYPPGDAGLPVIYVGQVQISNNADPVPSNNVRTVNSTLP